LISTIEGKINAIKVTLDYVSDIILINIDNLGNFKNI